MSDALVHLVGGTDLAPGTLVALKDGDGQLVELYADPLGLKPLPNPFAVGSSKMIDMHYRQPPGRAVDFFLVDDA